jgi:molybdopterin molybdotransferase
MCSLEEALQKILAAIVPLPVETIDLARAFGRFAVRPVFSPVNLPAADNSSVDGYAVRAADLAAASAGSPVTLRLAGYSPAGGTFLGRLESGACVRVFTGSLLPRGADAIVMQEDVKPQPGHPRNLLFSESVSPGENTRSLGDDVKQNDLLLEAGEKLTAVRLGLLAAAGKNRAPCVARPVVGLVATGSELREAGRPLQPGRIYESNRLSLSILAEQAGAVTVIYPLVSDDLAAIKSTLEKAFAGCDAVVTTGGISVGEMDWVRTAFAEIGGRLDFWNVDMKPGKPFAFGRREGKLFFGLPGNPVSALVTFFLLVRPALLQMQGARDLLPPRQSAPLAEALENRGDRRHFMRVTLDAAGQARSAGKQASHILSATARSHGLVDVPPNTTLPAGAVVQVLRWD